MTLPVSKGKAAEKEMRDQEKKEKIWERLMKRQKEFDEWQEEIKKRKEKEKK